MPPLSVMDNKARRGRCLLFAGSEQYPGAGILAGRAALRMGSGYVMLAQKNISVSAWDHPDFLLCDLAKTDWKTLKFDAILVGPGFGVNQFTAEILQELKSKKVQNVIVDADALTVCAQEKLFPLLPSWIATPHAGELARCLGTSAANIEQNRIAAAEHAFELFNCVVLLKGAGTLVKTQRSLYRIGSGNEALAKSGTGDVLAGMITALRAQGLSAVRAALLGAYVHGATANRWKAQGKDLLAMMASDVIDMLPETLSKIREKNTDPLK